ncbi:hypothetical protein HXX76_003479 [Chlamydomonas incerta]|uniref:Globin n=1 Tax=Chlamydomonas incerta TaxID=51695 RepID=A0A835TDT6_CHLIN|nr:hypothetical protein HXX76_003479 [Chlamydomonas incerta]|eukprot:KAG2441872.1 hypothetical protein HXX76_003479 [Chlamydomonas incerta]
MGNTCTHPLDSVAHLVTEDEIHEAVRSIEEWQRAQAQGVKSGAPTAANSGPLLQRVGGLDVVKKVVELFYRKLYADPHLIKFLADQDVMHLRAKQSMFVSWLFGPPGTPYTGKSVRVAHLRIIKQRGFSPEDFDLGMKYFEEAMTELGAPEVIRGEVMRRMKPFKDAFFTPAASDAAEEARWHLEGLDAPKADSNHASNHAASNHAASHHADSNHAASNAVSTTPSSALHAASAHLDGAVAAPAAAPEAAAAAPVAAASGSRPGSRQCPFTGGSLSRPASSAAAPTAAAAAVAAAPPPPSAVAPPDHSVSVMEAELEALGQATPSAADPALSVVAAVVEEGAAGDEVDVLGAEVAELAVAGGAAV